MIPRQPAIEMESVRAPVVPQVLTLAHARRIALQANPDVHAAQARLEAALARISESRASYFPTISAVHNSTRTFHTPRVRSPLIRPFPQQTVPDLFTADQQLNIDSVFSVLTSQLFGTESIGGADANSFSQHSSSLTLAWTLFDGFRREARLVAAKHTYRAEAMGLADVERLLTRAVDTAFLQALLGREQLRIAEADLRFSEEQLEITRQRRDQGKATEADVLNFQVRVRAAQANVTNARGVWETSRVVLAELLALPDAEMPAATTLPPLADERLGALQAPDESTWLVRAMRNRPDLAQLDHLVDAAEENVRVAKGQFLPTLTLTGSYGWERRSTIEYGFDDQASAMGLEINWRLFTGGFRMAQLRRFREEQREVEARHARARLSIASEVRQTIVSLINAQETVRLERLALEAAAENRRIVREQYAVGKASLVRLNQAQRDYVQSDVNVTAARIRLRQAWTDLHAASAAYAEGVSWADLSKTPQSWDTSPSSAP